MAKKIKFIVTGYSQHGKDTVAEILATLGYSFESSSMWMLDRHLWDLRYTDTKSGAKAPLHGGNPEYVDKGHMYVNRSHHRIWWKDMIKQINVENGLDYLGSGILTDNDVYCGLRDYGELGAIKEWAKTHDYTLVTIFVDASGRVPVCKADREGGLTIVESDCVYTLPNKNSKAELLMTLGRILLANDNCGDD